MIPVVRNLYQTHRQILFGFMTSLISKELLSNFTWTGKCESGMKLGFNDFKQIQACLLSAMIKVDKHYNLSQFKSDLQKNLSKCSHGMDQKQSVIMSVTTNPLTEIVNSDDRSKQHMEDINCENK